MKSTAVDESLSSTQLQFCSRENQLATINPTEWETCINIIVIFIDVKMTCTHALNLEHAQNALCFFADAYWLEWIEHAHYYVCAYPLKSLF